MPVTVNTGMRHSYLDKDYFKRDIADMIEMIDPYDVPLLRLLGAPRTPIRHTKHEWIEDRLVPTIDQLAEALDDSETAVDVDNGEYFLPNDVIRCENELMLVTAVTPGTTDVLTVVRGFAGSTAAAHNDNTQIERIGVARAEGAGFGEARSTAKTSDYNYTQIFDDIVEVSGTREVLSEYGVGSQFARELTKKLKERAIVTEKAILWGRRSEDLNTMRRTMGGLFEFINVNVVDAGGAELTKGRVDQITQEIWRAGGNPRTMVMNIDQKERFYAMYEHLIRKDESDRGLGGYVEWYESSLGRFNIVLDRWMPRDRILLLDLEKIGFGALTGRNWSLESLPKMADARKAVMLMEGTLEVRQREAHGLITGLPY